MLLGTELPPYCSRQTLPAPQCRHSVSSWTFQMCWSQAFPWQSEIKVEKNWENFCMQPDNIFMNEQQIMQCHSSLAAVCIPQMALGAPPSGTRKDGSSFVLWIEKIGLENWNWCKINFLKLLLKLINLFQDDYDIFPNPLLWCICSGLVQHTP